MKFQVLKPADEDIEPDLPPYPGRLRLIIWLGVLCSCVGFWAAAITILIKL